MHWKISFKNQNKKRASCSDQPEIVLYTTRSHGARYLYECIGAVGWVKSQMSNDSNIGQSIISEKYKIMLLPVGPYIFKLPYRWIKRFISIFKYIIANKTKHKGQSKTKSLYHSVHSGKTATLTYDQTTICIEVFREQILFHGYKFLKSLFNALFLWGKCFSNKKFSPNSFLGLHYQGIHIGDLAASTTLRAHPQLGGSLRACKELFVKLAEAIYICELVNSLSLHENAQNYVIVPEPTYLHAVYQRSLHARGVNILSFLSYKEKYFVVPSDQEFVNPVFASTPIDEVIDPSVINSYMNLRLLDPSQLLDYWVAGKNNNDEKKIYEINGDSIFISNNGLSVVVFLHSFDDAQYYFGLDGFSDIYDWTIFTIDTCLINNNITRVLIKPHPNVDFERYQGDRIALNKLINKYKNKRKITFLGKSSSLIALSKMGKLYGITHHGSVAEELVYLGQPVVASAYAPWTKSFPFLKTWRTIEEYEELITSISFDNWASPSESEREWLFRYIYEYRLKTIELLKIANIDKFVKVFAEKNIEFTNNNDLRWEGEFEAELRELDSNSEIFQELMRELFKE